jgi:16S rRNA (uracil1498-N3)-methyltransferase
LASSAYLHKRKQLKIWKQMPRFHCPVDLATGLELELPAGAARHVQVLRMQPGDAITLFHGGLSAGRHGRR